MAEGILKSLDEEFEIFSAGTKPEKTVNENAIKVMNEIGIDISAQYPKNTDIFVNDSFDYVITVCDNAKELCPVFYGIVKKKIHKGFNDPAIAKGSNEEIINIYRKIRDEIKLEFTDLYNKEIRKL